MATIWIHWLAVLSCDFVEETETKVHRYNRLYETENPFHSFGMRNIVYKQFTEMMPIGPGEIPVDQSHNYFIIFQSQPWPAHLHSNPACSPQTQSNRCLSASLSRTWA